MKRITVDFNQVTGPIRPEHGLCNYPVSCAHPDGSSDAESAEKAEALLREIEVPVSRLKDIVTMAYGKVLEVPYVFRDFSKDENDPKNYYFYATTGYVKEAAEESGRVMVRLGAPREYWEPIYCRKPENYDKFASVCCHIIRHINDGWAKGTHAGVRYWEIWNRADDPQCWAGGTWEDYYRLYETVAKKIKTLHPRLKVGGPAAADCSGDAEFLQGFLAYVKAHAVPIDFVSWNYYGTDPMEAFAQAKKVRQLVYQAKLPKRVEIVNDEWNCMTFDETGRFSVPFVRTLHGAAFDAAFMIKMNEARMDFSTYFDCQKGVPWGGLISNALIGPCKPLYAFVAYARLFKLGNAVKIRTAGRNLYALAASDGQKEALLFTLYQDKKDRVEIRGGFKGAKTVYVLDEKHDLEPVLTTEEETFTLSVSGYGVVYVEAGA